MAESLDEGVAGNEKSTTIVLLCKESILAIVQILQKQISMLDESFSESKSL